MFVKSLLLSSTKKNLLLRGLCFFLAIYLIYSLQHSVSLIHGVEVAFRRLHDHSIHTRMNTFKEVKEVTTILNNSDLSNYSSVSSSSKKSSSKRKNTSAGKRVSNLKTLLIGITSAADHESRRNLIRSTYLKKKPKSIDYVFVIAKPRVAVVLGGAGGGGSKASKSTSAALLLEKLAVEEKTYVDLMIIDMDETTDYGGGLTYLFFNQAYYHTWWASSSSTSKSSSSNSESTSTSLPSYKLPYSFVMKCDDDVWLHLPNLETRFSYMVKQGSDKGVYFGRQSERRHYMAGMGYALSRDWVKWLATTFPQQQQQLLQEEVGDHHETGGAIVHKSNNNYYYGTSNGGPEEAILSSWLHKSNVGGGGGGGPSFLKPNSISEQREIYDYPGFGKGWAHEYTKGTLLIHQVKEDEAFLTTHKHFF